MSRQYSIVDNHAINVDCNHHRSYLYSPYDPYEFISYLEVRDGIYENSTRIGTKVCGTNTPTKITSSGGELTLKLVASSLYENNREKGELKKLLRKIGGWRGFRIKIEAAVGKS